MHTLAVYHTVAVRMHAQVLRRVYTPTERTVRKNPRAQMYSNTTSMANMRKQNVRTGMGRARGMQARRAGVGGTGFRVCLTRISSQLPVSDLSE